MSRSSIRRFLATVGDSNPADYGGGYVIRYKHPGQSSFVDLECVQWDSDADNAEGSLYTGDLRDRDILKAHDWIDVDDMARLFDFDADEWRRMARGTIRERARCLEDIASYYGWDNLDSYPVRVTRDEVRKRYARVNGYRLPGV
jgi:hypothetical protein